MRHQRLFTLLGGLAAATAGAAIPAAPAAAQVQDRVITIYGNDKCPSDNGQGIVVCVRKPESDRFRIPRELRDSTPSEQSLARTAVAAVQTTGGNGTQVQSCNAVGAGTNAGCVKQGLDAWKAEQRAAKAAERDIP